MQKTWTLILHFTPVYRVFRQKQNQVKSRISPEIIVSTKQNSISSQIHHMDIVTLVLHHMLKIVPEGSSVITFPKEVFNRFSMFLTERTEIISRRSHFFRDNICTDDPVQDSDLEPF